MIRYLSIADIARHFGVDVSTVATWRKRYPGFPAPDATVGDHPGWRQARVADIEQWKLSRPGAGARTDLKEEK